MSKYQPTYQEGSRVERSPSNKSSYSPGTWKKYLIKNFDCEEKDSRMSKDKQSERSYNNPNTSSQISYDKLTEMGEQKQRKKEDMMRRVKQIQRKVMPLIENEENSHNVEEYNGRRKLEQKVGKLETEVDAIEKEMEIRIEKRILQIEKQYSQKIEALEKKIHSH